MKQISCFLLLLFFSCDLVAGVKQNTVTNPPIIVGKIFNADDQIIHITVFDPDQLLAAPLLITTQSTNGVFKAKLPFVNPQWIVLEVSGIPILSNVTGLGILVEPGDSIHINIPKISVCKLADVTFTGYGIEKYQFLQDLGRLFLDTPCEGNAWDRSLGQRIDCFTLQYDLVSQLVVRYAKRDNVAINPKIQNGVISSLVNNVVLSFLLNGKNDINRNELYYKRFLSELPFEKLLREGAASKGTSLYKILYDWVILEYQVSNNLTYSQINLSRKDIFFLMVKRYKSISVRDWVLATSIASQAKTEGWDEDLEEMYRLFLSLYPDKLYRKQIKELRHTMTKKIAPLAKAINFSLKDTTGRIFKMTDFKGKVVLIDFVLTGCAGCLTMVPELNKLKEKFIGKDIAFVSISADGSLELTKKGAGRYSSAGSILLYPDGEGTQHQVLQQYKIFSFPTLVLIDKNGKIISSRAPDPRSEKGRTELFKMIEHSLTK